MVAHPAAHFLAEALDVGGGGAAAIDQEVAVHLRDLGPAPDQAAAAGGIDELPRLAALGVLEGRAAGALADRLRRLAGGRHPLHLRLDVFTVSGTAAEGRAREDHVVRRRGMAVAKAHLGVSEASRLAGPVDAAGFRQHVGGLTTMGAGIHA